MITERDFFVLADDWNGPPSSTVHLFRQLSVHNRVFWMKTLSRMPKFSFRDAKKGTRILSRWVTQKWSSAANQAANTPRGIISNQTAMMLPYFNRTTRRLNQAAIKHQFESVSRRFEVKDPIILTSTPATADFVERLEFHPKLYFCLDEWTQYPNLDRGAYERMEAQLIANVDGYIATSRRLMEKAPKGAPQLYLPQGVDFARFHFGRTAKVTVSAMEEIPKPIVGFFGLIAEWVDLNAIKAACNQFPEVSFVLIGDSQVNLSDLLDQPNIHYIGFVPYTELPNYARYFDVGIIPFVSNDLTKAVNPLKLLEYFALGLPVIASGLPELRHMEGPILLADDANEFCNGIGQILRAPGSYAEEAISVAKENTWEARANSLSRFLNTLE